MYVLIYFDHFTIFAQKKDGVIQSQEIMKCCDLCRLEEYFKFWWLQKQQMGSYIERVETLLEVITNYW